jgi:hypothetical protein
MDISVRLIDLAMMHPRLLWADIGAAALAVLDDAGAQAPFPFQLAIRDVPGFGSGTLRMAIGPDEIPPAHVARLRRTHDPSRLVELAGIAIAGLGLYHAGGHEIRDVALRGSAADYLVDEANHLLEIAGRSRRSDFGAAWQQRWRRLSEQRIAGFYVCVAEFETRTGQLVFQA